MLKEMLEDLLYVKTEFHAKLPQLKNRMGNMLKDSIVKYTPRDTGNLQNSYRVKVSGNVIEVSTDVEYAPYVDNGHSRGSSYIKGAHMYDKALNEFHSNSDRLVQDFLNSLKVFG